METEAAQKCMDEYLAWFWGSDPTPSFEEIRAFLAERGMTVEEMFQLYLDKTISRNYPAPKNNSGDKPRAFRWLLPELCKRFYRRIRGIA